MSKSYLQYPGVKIHPRNFFTTVPQPSTPRCHSDFRAFSTLFPNFRTFLLQISTLSPKRVSRTFEHVFFSVPSRFKATFATILTSLTWIYGVPRLQPKNTRKTQKFVLFCKNHCFLRSKAFHWVTLHCKKE